MKRAVSILMAALLSIAVTGCGGQPADSPDETSEETEPVITELYAPRNADEYTGKVLGLVTSELNEAGFKDIETTALGDLTSQEKAEDGKVESVVIGDEDSYAEGDVFPLDAKVVITYHSIPTVEIPFDSKDMKTMDIDELMKGLEDAGFVNISVEEVYDIDPDTGPAHEAVVRINNSTSITKGNTYYFDSPIVITYHLPYEKYNVKIIVDFLGNIMFNKYDVYFEIDKEQVGRLPHGEDKTFEVRLKEGEYTLRFVKTSDEAVDGEIELLVDSDLEAQYKISCYKETVSIEEIYIDRDKELAKDQAKVNCYRTGFQDRPYKEVIKELKSLGFTNLYTKPYYDSNPGDARIGTVRDVTIDGSTDYKKGDIFKSNVKVVVSYHESRDADPSKPKESETPKPSPTPSATPKPTPTPSPSPTPSSKPKTYDYSTNDETTIKDGNRGVYAYRTYGAEYHVYYIIDFNENCVYRFPDNDSYYDKVPITSGDLNSVLIITYREGNRTSQEKLCFIRQNHPEYLKIQEENGNVIQLDTTNLNEALKLRDQRKVIEW